MSSTDDVLAIVRDYPGLDRLLGVELDQHSPDLVVLHLAVGQQHTQAYGLVHGGIYAALAETAVSVGAILWVRARGGSGAVGLSNATDFLRATRDGTLTTTATPLQRGRSVQLWEARTTDSAGRLVAHSKVRMFNISEPDRRVTGPVPAS